MIYKILRYRNYNMRQKAETDRKPTRNQLDICV